MACARFRLNVLYNTIAVFAKALDYPFPDWTEIHAQQGFAWRAVSATFATIIDGPHDVEICRDDSWSETTGDAVRVIEVPFTVQDPALEVGSIPGGERFLMPPGDYTIRFECFDSKEPTGRARITFLPQSDGPQFRVVRADPDLNVPSELCKTAEPA
jgi:hypothetical protein